MRGGERLGGAGAPPPRDRTLGCNYEIVLDDVGLEPIPSSSYLFYLDVYTVLGGMSGRASAVVAPTQAPTVPFRIVIKHAQINGRAPEIIVCRPSRIDGNSPDPLSLNEFIGNDREYCSLTELFEAPDIAYTPTGSAGQRGLIRRGDLFRGVYDRIKSYFNLPDLGAGPSSRISQHDVGMNTKAPVTSQYTQTHTNDTSDHDLGMRELEAELVEDRQREEEQKRRNQQLEEIMVRYREEHKRKMEEQEAEYRREMQKLMEEMRYLRERRDPAPEPGPRPAPYSRPRPVSPFRDDGRRDAPERRRRRRRDDSIIDDERRSVRGEGGRRHRDDDMNYDAGSGDDGRRGARTRMRRSVPAEDVMISRRRRERSVNDTEIKRAAGAIESLVRLKRTNNNDNPIYYDTERLIQEVIGRLRKPEGLNFEKVAPSKLLVALEVIRRELETNNFNQLNQANRSLYEAMVRGRRTIKGHRTEGYTGIYKPQASMHGLQGGREGTYGGSTRRLPPRTGPGPDGVGEQMTFPISHISHRHPNATTIHHRPGLSQGGPGGGGYINNSAIHGGYPHSDGPGSGDGRRYYVPSEIPDTFPSEDPPTDIQQQKERELFNLLRQQQEMIGQLMQQQREMEEKYIQGIKYVLARGGSDVLEVKEELGRVMIERDEERAWGNMQHEFQRGGVRRGMHGRDAIYGSGEAVAEGGGLGRVPEVNPESGFGQGSGDDENELEDGNDSSDSSLSDAGSGIEQNKMDELGEEENNILPKPDRDAEAIRIQALYRGYIGRKELENLKAQKRAQEATNIQKVYRGHRGRKAVKEKRVEFDAKKEELKLLQSAKGNDLHQPMQQSAAIVPRITPPPAYQLGDERVIPTSANNRSRSLPLAESKWTSNITDTRYQRSQTPPSSRSQHP